MPWWTTPPPKPHTRRPVQCSAPAPLPPHAAVPAQRCERPAASRSRVGRGRRPSPTLRARSGPAVTRPAKATKALAPVRPGRFPAMAASTRPAAAASSRTAPATMRTRPTPLEVGVDSRSASIGATRVPVRAGMTAATSVTPTPTTSAATTVRGATTAVVLGTSTPTACSSRRMPAARPTPAPMPRAAETRPRTRASVTTPVTTWRRVAPTARNRATSRRRCASTTLKVFQMTNDPTRSDTAANASRTLVKMPRPSRTALDDSSDTWAEVTASTPEGTAAAMRCRRSSVRTPSAARTSTWSTRPCLPSTRCAVRPSKVASVAPARLSASPNPTTPTTVNVPVPSSKTIRALSPGTYPALAAVAASRATWSG
jgi:hypothetical protein